MSSRVLEIDEIRQKGLGNMVLFNYSVFSPLGSAVRAEGDLIF